MKRLFLLFLLPCFLCSNTCTTLRPQTKCEWQSTSRIKGLSFTAPPNPFPADPMPPVKAVNADWIAVIPYGYTRPGRAHVSFNIDWQWWGEKIEGTAHTIKSAHAAQLKVMLKPQVYMPGSWVGDLQYKTNEKWKKWETDYEKYILTMAQLADSLDVEMLCIGTEFAKSTAQRSQFWQQLIRKIRDIYTGKLIYAANWDDYENIPFWQQMDYIGINTYFPLDKNKTPTISDLRKAWQPYARKMENFAFKQNKPIIFTEYGYLTVDGCAYNTWELEAKIKRLPRNEQAQANAIEALLTEFKQYDWWQGGFLWKWFPNGQGGEGYNDRDYTPQGKQAEEILRKCYGEIDER